jgi:acetyl-CoA/propionyl-CoA carboxylase biotin carboxyl carrier protein
LSVPVAIKAAFGGGGRGLKVARTRDEIPELFESATREAIAAFGRGECFVEKYLDQPRHVETQCLADAHGNVVVISTRDCSLQRRHQKLVEEAPAPFLTVAQNEQLYTSSKAILKEVGYIGAGTCEFLVAKDGTISFLEVNTRLQVEHPVSEEVTGIDLVREQFRIAEGGVLDYDDPIPQGHSFEFRINGEDPGLNFMPAPGPVNVLRFPGGPGVRVDSGVTTGDVISGAFDSLLAKLIVTGATREDALERSRRALDEFEVAGLPTVLPFHRKIVRDPAFTSNPFSIYTRWIETDFDNDIEPWSGSLQDSSAASTRHNVIVEVDGKRIEVSLPTKLLPSSGGVSNAVAPKRRRKRLDRHRRHREGAHAGDDREARGRRRRRRGEGRPDPGARGHEDGTADHRAQRRHHHRHRGRRRHHGVVGARAALDRVAAERGIRTPEGHG